MIRLSLTAQIMTKNFQKRLSSFTYHVQQIISKRILQNLYEFFDRNISKTYTHVVILFLIKYKSIKLIYY